MTLSLQYLCRLLILNCFHALLNIVKFTFASCNKFYFTKSTRFFKSILYMLTPCHYVINTFVVCRTKSTIVEHSQRQV